MSGLPDQDVFYEHNETALWDFFLRTKGKGQYMAPGSPERAVLELFEKMGEPVPTPDQVMVTPKAMRVIFDRYSLIASFVFPEKTGLLKGLFRSSALPKLDCVDTHPLVLKPLFATTVGEGRNICRIEINPGVHHICTEDSEKEAVQTALRNDGIIIRKRPQEAVGVIRDPSSGEEQSIWINRRLVVPSGEIQIDESVPDLQHKVLGELRAEAESAFGSREEDAIRGFLNECARITALPSGHKDKLLGRHWRSKGIESKRLDDMCDSAKAYALAEAAAVPRLAA